jgi:hypothetical protein
MCSLASATARLSWGSIDEFGETVEWLAGETRWGSQNSLVQFQKKLSRISDIKMVERKSKNYAIHYHRKQSDQ